MKTFRERLKEGAFGSVPFISAFAFVVLVGLLAIFAAAEKKSEWINTIATVLGAGGQVFLAFMVWKLSSQQFEFAKSISKDQNRIALFSSRYQAVAGFEDWFDRNFQSPNDDSLTELFRHTQLLKTLFGRKVHDRIDDFAESFIKYSTAFYEMRLHEANKAHFLEMLPLRMAHSNKRADSLMTKGLALSHMHDEMRIEANEIDTDSVWR